MTKEKIGENLMQPCIFNIKNNKFCLLYCSCIRNKINKLTIIQSQRNNKLKNLTDTLSRTTDQTHMEGGRHAAEDGKSIIITKILCFFFNIHCRINERAIYNWL